MGSLVALNLAVNKFDGHIPPTLGSAISLETLTLRNNNFTGELPSTLSNCVALMLIDCGGNALTGHVPAWMGSLTNLVVLVLGRNNFYGSISLEIFRHSLIQVLDLSENNISGTIPQCFQNFTFLIQTNGQSNLKSVYVRNSHPNDVIVRWKRQLSEYKNTLGLLKLIDLSSNNLVGNIPLEISSLVGLASLNLSHNHLRGSIILGIGQMKMLETLDLSRNSLSGEIPDGLAELSFLNTLDFSSNNLSGKIPQSTHLQSFNPSSFFENTTLRGEPLPNCSEDNPSHEQKDEGFNFIRTLIEEYFISAVLGYIVGFWVTLGPLLFKRSWRNAYFGYLNMIGYWLHVTVTLSWRRLARYMKRKN